MSSSDTTYTVCSYTDERQKYVYRMLLVYSLILLATITMILLLKLNSIMNLRTYGIVRAKAAKTGLEKRK
jgi:hypothetical protein